MLMREHWDWGGAVVLVLAVGFSIGWIAAVIEILGNPAAYSPDYLATVMSVGNGLLIVIAGFLGLRFGRYRITKPVRKDDDS